MMKKILRWIGKIVLIFFAFTILLTLLYRWVNPPITMLMISRSISEDYPINKDWISIEEMPQSLINCVVASEDNNFLSHGGIDFGAVEKAIEYNKKGKKKRGASTVSQQTAKNVFLWESRTWVRKGFEVYFTFLIETLWSKERIMEVYLNVIEMGQGVYGIQAAADYYFNKPASKLTPMQSALIVAAFPSPLRYDPKNPSAYLNRRANAILSLSRKIGKVKFDEESIEKAKERYEKREEKRKKKKK